jgi:hypothetical protein
VTPEELIPDAPHSDGEIRSAVRQKSRPVRFAERLAGERDEHPEVLADQPSARYPIGMGHSAQEVICLMGLSRPSRYNEGRAKNERRAACQHYG